MTAGGEEQARTWVEHGSPAYAQWMGMDPALGPALLHFIGQPCLISKVGVSPGWLRIDFAGGFSYKVEESARFRVAPLSEQRKPGRRRRFGASVDLDQVAEALAGYFGLGELRHLARQVEKRRAWRGRRGKSTGLLAGLHRVLVTAVARALPDQDETAVLHLFAGPDSDEPLAVTLTDGTVTRDIPQGASFKLAAGSPAGDYFVGAKGLRTSMFLTPKHLVEYEGSDGITRSITTTRDGSSV